VEIQARAKTLRISENVPGKEHFTVAVGGCLMLANFAAQNSRAKALGQNRRSYEKLQGRTNLPLT
jgi:hypothetical protein